MEVSKKVMLCEEKHDKEQVEVEMQHTTLKEKLIGKLSRARRWQHTKQASVMKRKALGVLVGLLVLGGVALTFAEGGSESGSETVNNANVNYLYTQTGVYCGELSAADYDTERFEAAFTASTEIDTNAVATCEYYDETNAGADAGVMLTATLAEENGNVVFLADGAENTDIGSTAGAGNSASAESTTDATGTENADTEDATNEAAGPEDQTANEAETETAGGAETQTQTGTATQATPQTLDFAGVTVLTEKGAETEAEEASTAEPLSLAGENDLMLTAVTIQTGCTSDTTKYGTLNAGCVMIGEGYDDLPTIDYQLVDPSAMTIGNAAVQISSEGFYVNSSAVYFNGTSGKTYSNPLTLTWKDVAYDQDGNKYNVVLALTSFVGVYSSDATSCDIVVGIVDGAVVSGCGTSVEQGYKLSLTDQNGETVSGNFYFYAYDIDVPSNDSKYSSDSGNTARASYAEGFTFGDGQKSDALRGNSSGVDEKYTTLYRTKINGNSYYNSVWGSQYTTDNFDSDLPTDYASVTVALDASGAEFEWYGTTDGMGTTLWGTHDTYTIESSVTGSGTINGGTGGSDTTFWKNDREYCYEASEGWLIGSVTVDGEAVDFATYPSCYRFENVTADHTIAVEFVQLETAKSVLTPDGADLNGQTVNVGDHLVYTITVTNPTDSTRVFTVTDPLPAHTTFLSADNNGVYDTDTHTVTWTLDLTASQTLTLSVEVLADDTASATVLENTATAAVANPDGTATSVATNTVTTNVAELKIPDTGTITGTGTDGASYSGNIVNYLLVAVGALGLAGALAVSGRQRD